MDTHEKIKVLVDQIDEGAEQTNAHRAAKLLHELFLLYEEADPENPSPVIVQALFDIHHACDLLGLTYKIRDRMAHIAYLKSVCEEGGPARFPDDLDTDTSCDFCHRTDCICDDAHDMAI